MDIISVRVYLFKTFGIKGGLNRLRKCVASESCPRCQNVTEKA